MKRRLTFVHMTAFAGGGLTDVVRTEWDDSLAITGGVGYSWGTKGRLQVTYWNYSDDTEARGSTSGAYYQYSWLTVGPVSAFGYSAYGGPYYLFGLDRLDFDINQEIEASAIDVEFLRTQTPAESLAVTWGVGLRRLDFEDRVEGVYGVNPNGLDLLTPVFRTIEADGFGFSGQVGVAYELSRLVGLGTSLRVGFVGVEVDAAHGFVEPVASIAIDEEVTLEDEIATTIDLGAGVLFRIGGFVDLGVGWSYTSWWDAPQVPLSRHDLRLSASGFTFNPAGVDIPGEDRDRIAWSGPRAAVTVRFGK